MTVLTKLRVRNGALLAKKQVSAGAFLSPSASTDAVLVEGVQIGVNPKMINTNEFTGSLDPRSPLVGGQTYQLTMTCYIKGSGVPGTPPEAGDLFQMCSLQEVITATSVTATTIGAVNATNKLTTVTDYTVWATAGTVITVSGFANAANNGQFLVASSSAAQIVLNNIATGAAAALVDEAAGPSVTITRGVSGVVATAGSTTSFTAQAPWSSTAEAYRFMPVLLSSNPATPATSFLSDYTAGMVGTLVDLMGSALTASTKMSIFPHVLYVPFSGTTIPWGSIELYGDGKRWQFLDCIGKFTPTFTVGGVVKGTLTLQGKFFATNDAAVPAAVYDSSRPGIWRNSKFLLDRAAVSLQSLMVDFATTLVFPDNPNDGEGLDAPIHDSRNVNGSMDPHMTLTATRDMLGDFRNGTSRIVHATVAGSLGSAIGNRVAITIPSAKYIGYSPGQQQGLYTEQTKFFCEGQDSGAGLVFW